VGLSNYCAKWKFYWRPVGKYENFPERPISAKSMNLQSLSPRTSASIVIWRKWREKKPKTFNEMNNFADSQEITFELLFHGQNSEDLKVLEQLGELLINSSNSIVSLQAAANTNLSVSFNTHKRSL